jgi:hypothetical protein
VVYVDLGRVLEFAFGAAAQDVRPLGYALLVVGMQHFARRIMQFTLERNN